MAWLPEPTEQLQALYDSADDSEIDDQTTILEDSTQTLEQIQAACRRFKVRARVMRGEKLIGRVAADGEYRAAT